MEGSDPVTSPGEDIEGNDGDEDADMGVVQEAGSEEEMGVVHEDFEDEMSATFFCAIGSLQQVVPT